MAESVSGTKTTTVELLRLAERWARTSGSTLTFWPMDLSCASELVAQEGNAMLACALQLRAMLAGSADFAQAIEDLGLEPVGQDAKGPGA